MVVLDNMKIEIQNLKPTLDEVTASLDLESKKKRIEELNREMEEPTFWDDAEKANKKTKELKNMQDLIEKIEHLNVQYGDIIDMIDMCNDEGTEDNDMADEIRADLDEFETVLEEIRIANLLNGEYDKCNAILKLSAGAGGTEACD
jgi:peptide chain release factor 2